MMKLLAVLASLALLTPPAPQADTTWYFNAYADEGRMFCTGAVEALGEVSSYHLTCYVGGGSDQCASYQQSGTGIGCSTRVGIGGVCMEEEPGYYVNFWATTTGAGSQGDTLWIECW